MKLKMGYINTLMVAQMKWLNLFDDIFYKNIKDIIDEDEDDIEVEIKDMDCGGDGQGVDRCKTSFTFTLNINVSGGSLPIWTEKKYTVEKEYSGSSPMALYIMDLYNEDSEEEEEEEEEEEGSTVYYYLEDHTLTSIEKKDIKDKWLVMTVLEFDKEDEGGEYEEGAIRTEITYYDPEITNSNGGYLEDEEKEEEEEEEEEENDCNRCDGKGCGLCID